MTDLERITPIEAVSEERVREILHEEVTPTLDRILTELRALRGEE
ncbi:MAG: hypothetical protein QHC65_06540 [Sphingomonas sp.]|nr:hypothetical protein [Sphingomonas sp.]MDX3884061.1 hypothetical protein [Sphingomonas sp.]